MPCPYISIRQIGFMRRLSTVLHGPSHRDLTEDRLQDIEDEITSSVMQNGEQNCFQVLKFRMDGN